MGKFLVVGLGNPDEYSGTRHNIGFEIVNHLCKSRNIVCLRTVWFAENLNIR